MGDFNWPVILVQDQPFTVPESLDCFVSIVQVTVLLFSATLVHGDALSDGLSSGVCAAHHIRLHCDRLGEHYRALQAASAKTESVAWIGSVERDVPLDSERDARLGTPLLKHGAIQEWSRVSRRGKSSTQSDLILCNHRDQSVRRYPAVLCGGSEHVPLVGLSISGILRYPWPAVAVSLTPPGNARYAC